MLIFSCHAAFSQGPISRTVCEIHIKRAFVLSACVSFAYLAHEVFQELGLYLQAGRSALRHVEPIWQGCLYLILSGDVLALVSEQLVL